MNKIEEFRWKEIIDPNDKVLSIHLNKHVEDEKPYDGSLHVDILEYVKSHLIGMSMGKILTYLLINPVTYKYIQFMLKNIHKSICWVICSEIQPYIECFENNMVNVIGEHTSGRLTDKLNIALTRSEIGTVSFMIIDSSVDIINIMTKISSNPSKLMCSTILFHIDGMSIPTVYSLTKLFARTYVIRWLGTKYLLGVDYNGNHIELATEVDVSFVHLLK